MSHLSTAASEDQRQRALERLGVLATATDADCDRLLQLLAAVCARPVAFAAFYNHNHTWLKSAVGMTVRELPADLDLWSLVVGAGDLAEVSDLRADAHCASHPWVTGQPYLRSFAGLPLVTSTGVRIGSLCVAGKEPGQLGALELLTLRTVAQQIMALLERGGPRSASTEAKSPASSTPGKKRRLQRYSGYAEVLRKLLRNPALLIAVKDPGQRYIQVSAGMAALLGRPRAACLGHTDQELGINVAEVPRSDIQSAAVASSGGLPTSSFPNMNWRGEDGTEHQLVAERVNLCHQPGLPQAELWLARDLTYPRLLEQRLASASRLVTIGTMAAGIAHELNNPLTVLMGIIERLSDRLNAEAPDLGKCREDMKKLGQNSERMARIIRGMRAMSRNSADDLPEVMTATTIVNQVLEISQQRLKAKGVELRMDVAPEVKIRCLGVQIAQILVNLLNNAIDAIETQPDPWIQITVTADGGKALLRVTDCGPGLPKAVAARLGEVFFTTKGVGKGTGLGLSISRTIASNHGGVLRYDEAAPNTSFVLELPLASRSSTAA